MSNKHHKRLPAQLESLEPRCLLSATLLRPDHVVVVIEEDRFSGAIGDNNLPYLNGLVPNSLVYTNSHGIGHPSEPNYLALYSGSAQGITDNGPNYTFSNARNLSSQLNSTKFNGSYMSFAGYSENLPTDGDTTTTTAGDPNDPSAPPDLYVRNYNPMAMFTNVGTQNGVAVANSAVNRRFADFPTTSSGFNSMATVSFVIPNNLHNTHGSNEQEPWAADPDDRDQLRHDADTWLKNNMSAYSTWASTHNSLLIITTDEEETDSTPTSTISTLITGDPRLFVAGVDSTSINHFNLVRTLEDMYGLSYLGSAATASDLPTNTNGQLTTDLPTWLSPTSSGVWNATTNTFTVTGTATITANPGSAQPNITGSSASAQLTVQPNGTTGGPAQVGNVNLTGGASITIYQTATLLSNVLIVNGSVTAFTGKIDLTDGGMIVNAPSGDPTSGLETLLASGRSTGQWNGATGITSSTANADYAAHHFEITAVGIARNGSLFAPYKTFAGQGVNNASVLLRYTAMCDADLNGKVDDDDVTVLNLYYDNGATTGHHWWQGDFDGNGKIDDDDVTLMGLFYGSSTPMPAASPAMLIDSVSTTSTVAAPNTSTPSKKRNPKNT